MECNKNLYAATACRTGKYGKRNKKPFRKLHPDCVTVKLKLWLVCELNGTDQIDFRGQGQAPFNQDQLKGLGSLKALTVAAKI